MKALFFSLLFAGFASLVYAQDFKWPEDRLTAEEKNALYSDHLRVKEYRNAADHLFWLLQNAPELSVSLYQNGTKIYENLTLTENDPELKQVYADSTMLLFDLRMKYYQDSVNVMNRKAFSAYKLFKDNPDRSKYLLEQYDLLYEIGDNDILKVNLLPYMYAVKILQDNGGSLSDEEILERYDRMVVVYDYKKSKGENGNLDRQKEIADNILADLVNIDCDFIENNLGPKLREDPDNLSLAKKMFSLMLNGKCTDSELFLETSMIIHENEPSYVLAYKIIGRNLARKGDFSGCERYYEESIDLAENNEQKAEVYVDLGKVLAAQNKKKDAESAYQKALTYKPGYEDAYEGLGNLYFNSQSECATLEDQVKDRLVYILAHEMYVLAGNEKMAEKSREQFPSRVDLFQLDLEPGELMHINCWINKDVKLQIRD